MKTLIVAASVCLGIGASSAQSQAAISSPQPPILVTAPHIVPVWWGGPSTVCHRGYYGGVWCRPARPLGWIPGHHDWRGFWIPGHWN